MNNYFLAIEENRHDIIIGVTGVHLTCVRAHAPFFSSQSSLFCRFVPAEGKQMGAAAVCGKNMKNVIELRGLQRVKCPDRRGDIMYDSLP